MVATMAIANRKTQIGTPITGLCVQSILVLPKAGKLPSITGQDIILIVIGDQSSTRIHEIDKVGFIKDIICGSISLEL